MRARSDNDGLAPDARALYSIRALANIAGVSEHLLRRLLIRAGVVFVRCGRTAIVPLGEIRQRLPSLWDALVAKEALRAAGEARAKEAGERAVARREERGRRGRLV